MTDVVPFLFATLVGCLLLELARLVEVFLAAEEVLASHYMVMVLLKLVLERCACHSELVLYLVEVECVFADIVACVDWIN